MPYVLSPRDLVSKPDNMDETILSSAGKKTVKLRPKMLKFKISSCRESGFTPESNLTYPSSQDNFSLMP